MKVKGVFTPERQRLKAAVNELARHQPHDCRYGMTYRCCFCSQYIVSGNNYRNSVNLAAHETCFKAVAGEYK
jgi:hypothetical protein